MGMFDYLVVEDQIPYPDKLGEVFSSDKVEFQTKSLDKTLSTYIIKNKKLYLQEEDGETQVDFHGFIFFGGVVVADKLIHYIDFKAKFSDGILQDIIFLDYKKTENESRNWHVELNKRKNKISNKISNKIKKIIVDIFGFFGLKNGVYICFPEVVFLYKKLYKSKKYGFLIDNTGICLEKNRYSTRFVIKILGFGLEIYRFKNSNSLFD
jgi:hypothetical protein